MKPPYHRFDTLLIANRGEIACRVIRTARAMGLRTVAVYSEVDRDALHVSLADEAVLLGPAPARESYLNIDRVIEAAQKTGAQAVHPGYGFLSESAEFARRCAAAGLVFVGPTAEMIEAMGSKSGSKILMEKAGVPLVPGYHGEAQDDATLSNAADKIGFPVLVKASAGGGGRGMRVVRASGELKDAIVSAKRESLAAFGDDRMLIEKYVDSPRHIEVQVVGDSHGNLVSLFERECTLQRRHQKVIEEAPSPTLSTAQREAICAVARKAASAVNYVGAGTVEFVSDGKEFFFIEMNTRLQVEHPVTELVTGIDLVEWQLRVAFGEKLPLTQDQIALNGHAIEARVYAENPNENFMPSVGRIKTWSMPEGIEGLRIDAGYAAGKTVPANYDAMLAKVITYAPTRDLALARLNRGLTDLDIRGVTTNTQFLSALVTHPDVRANRIDTNFIARELMTLTPDQAEPSQIEICAAVAAILSAEAVVRSGTTSPWFSPMWIGAGTRRQTFTFKSKAQDHAATLTYGRGSSTLAVGNESVDFSYSRAAHNSIDLTINSVKSRVTGILDGRDVYVRTANGKFTLHWLDVFGAEEETQAGADRVIASLPGTVVALLVQEGAKVEKGAPILTLEVMKMEQTLRAPFAGVVKQLKCKVGDIVQEGVELAEIEPDAEPAKP